MLRLLSVLAIADAELYCPDQSSFQIDGGAVWTGAGESGSGWSITGIGGVHGLTSFNLLGGYMEFDVDTSGATPGMNSNFYTISPDHPYTSYQDYCDGQGPEASSPTGTYCMEMDIFEADGSTCAAVAWHTWPNRNGDCDMGGCSATQNVGGHFHVKAAFGMDGWMHTSYNYNEVNNFNRWPSDNVRDYVKQITGQHGVAIQSTQWYGWAPCGGASGLDQNSVFKLSNLKISGSVIYGAEPRKCGAAPTPSPSPNSIPTPAPAPSNCPGGGLPTCIGLCPSDATVYHICVDSCLSRCVAQSVSV